MDGWDLAAGAVLGGSVALTVAGWVAIDRLLERRVRRDRAWMLRETPHLVEGVPEHAARFREPDVAGLQRLYGRPVPTVYVEMHRSGETTVLESFVAVPPDAVSVSETWEVSGFVPPDPDGVSATWCVDRGELPVATDGFGNVYFLRLAECDERDGPVDFISHDAGEGGSERVADSLAAFLSWRRVSWAEAGGLFDSP